MQQVAAHTKITSNNLLLKKKEEKERMDKFLASVARTSQILAERGTPEEIAQYEQVKQRYVKLGFPLWKLTTLKGV